MENNQEPDTSYRNLAIKNISFAFVVLAIGLGLAFVAFAGQTMYYTLFTKVITEENRNKPAPKTAAFITIEETRNPMFDRNIFGTREKRTVNRNEGKHLLPASDVVKTESPKMNSVADVDIETAIKEIKENVFVSKEIHSLRPINDGDIGNEVPPEILVITEIDT